MLQGSTLLDTVKVGNIAASQLDSEQTESASNHKRSCSHAGQNLGVKACAGLVWLCHIKRCHSNATAGEQQKELTATLHLPTQQQSNALRDSGRRTTGGVLQM